MLSLLIWFINMQTDMQQPESIHARQDAQRAITLTKVGLLNWLLKKKNELQFVYKI